jgi:thiamine biosynthesis protein ThiI
MGMERAALDQRFGPRTARSSGELGVVVHYNEIGLKGRNRGFFERRLVRNLESVIGGGAKMESLTGRLVLHTATEASEDILDGIGSTFGVASYAPCTLTGVDIAAMIDAALARLDPLEFATFAVAARRATKELPITSRQINVEVGAAIQGATGAAVNLGSPDATVYVEVVGGRAFVYVDRRQGPGGLPVGVSGKVVSLLSGGIDSPVATYRILKRGAQAILCHFHSAPFTDRSSVRKASELAGVIAGWQGDTTLHLVPLGDAQQQIVLSAPPDLRVVLYRRLMVRVGAEIARQEGARAMVTGDSLGQVASQTLDNIACVDDVSPMPLLRPLIGDDKQEIIAQAKRIGTYETSILPYEDCCSLFVPRSPATRASISECDAAEASLDVGALVRSCLDGTETERIARLS